MWKKLILTVSLSFLLGQISGSTAEIPKNPENDSDNKLSDKDNWEGFAR
ncbi:hypothetical protein ACFL1G_06490 [Planctomycetota bacterium]